MRALIVMLFSLAAQGQTPVWIDTDPSVAPGGHEVDDGFALIQAFHSPELAVRGVSLVFGNAPLARAIPIAQQLLSLLSPERKAFPGASAANQLGVETPASLALEAELRKERLTILAIGPVTNVATVVKLHPELAAKMARVVAVAGRRPGQRFISGPKQAAPFRDFNFEMDPAAFQVLLDASIVITLAPWEISSKVWLRSEDLARIRQASPALRFMYAPASDWLHLWENSFGTSGFNPFDTLAVAAVASPQFLRCETLPVEIQTLPDDVGDGPSKPYLLAGPSIRSGRTVEYCFQAKQAFKNDLMKRLLAH